MAFAVENIRLRELAIVAEQNRTIYEDFVTFLDGKGYPRLYDFVVEKSVNRAQEVLEAYLGRRLPRGVILYDGVAKPYPANQAKWFLVSWIFRDAPVQRLQRMVSAMEGETLIERRARLLNVIRRHVATVFPDPARWEWNVIVEVVIDRLEGSRRAIRGTLFEAIVRAMLTDVFADEKIEARVGKVQVKLHGETYDVSIEGAGGMLLIPVKTRETTGGGQAGLFTRDIHKSIEAAHRAKYQCLPIVVAESWTGSLASLSCEDHILIGINPNKLDELKPVLERELRKRLPLFRALTRTAAGPPSGNSPG